MEGRGMAPSSNHDHQQPHNSMPHRFPLKTLFGVMTCVALLSATAAWVLEPEIPRGSWQLPVLFYFSTGMIGFGILVVPWLTIGLFVASVVLACRSRPRAYSSLYFFGLVLLVFGFDMAEPNFVRWLLAVLVGAIAFVAEAFGRGLPLGQRQAALLALGVPMGAYYFLLSIIASAAC